MPAKKPPKNTLRPEGRLVSFGRPETHQAAGEIVVADLKMGWAAPATAQNSSGTRKIPAETSSSNGTAAAAYYSRHSRPVLAHNQVRAEYQYQPLPPFPVLLQWLHFYHNQTGEWEEPPLSADQASLELERQPEIKNEFPPFLNLFSKNNNPVKSEKEGEGEAKEEKTAIENPVVSELKIVNRKKARAGSRLAIQLTTGGSTGKFDYFRSAYYEVARMAIERYSVRELAPATARGCGLVLALLLAWCHHPLYRGRQGRTGHTGRWMTLPLNRCAVETGMRVATFQLYLTELQACGLIRLTRLDDRQVFSLNDFEGLRQDVKDMLAAASQAGDNALATGWTNRSIQTRNTAYLLNFPLDELPALGVFNPGSMLQPQKSDRTGIAQLKPEFIEPGKIEAEVKSPNPSASTRATEVVSSTPTPTPTPVLPLTFPQTAQTARTDQEVLPASYPALAALHDNTCIISSSSSLTQIDNIKKESNHDSADYKKPNNNNNKNKHEHDPVTRAKLNFLVQEARFEGLARLDGLLTLDPREALKFAQDKKLTLETIRTIYTSINRLWLSRSGPQKVSNPIGLFHWALTHWTVYTNQAGAGAGAGSGKPGNGSKVVVVVDGTSKPVSSPSGRGLTGLPPHHLPTAGDKREQSAAARRLAGWRKISGHSAVSSAGVPASPPAGAAYIAGSTAQTRASYPLISSQPGCLHSSPLPSPQSGDVNGEGPLPGLRQPGAILFEETKIVVAEDGTSEGRPEPEAATCQNGDGGIIILAEQVWQKVMEDDLPGRFRVNAEQLQLLAGTSLQIAAGFEEKQPSLPPPPSSLAAAGVWPVEIDSTTGHLSLLTGYDQDDEQSTRVEVQPDAVKEEEEKRHRPGPATVIVRLRGAIELLQLETSTRARVEIALRQRLGPGFTISFES